MSELIGRTASDFGFQKLDGSEARFSDYGGKLILLTVFHSGCPWCRIELPRLAGIYAGHDDLNVQILGIAVGQDTPESAQAFAQELELTFPIGVDTRGEMRQAYPLGRVPTILVIDRAGMILRAYEGWAEQLPGIVDQAMLSIARGDELPDYALVGNGCAVG